jgi:hypothetical protein
MTQPPVIQPILNVQDGLFGLRYLKIVKSPTGPHYIVDVMFKMGLRLTADILPGMPVQDIGDTLDKKLQTHRPSEYHDIKPAVDFVSECAGRALSDEFGKIAEKQLNEEALREAWEMTLFRRYLRRLDPKRVLEYEQAMEYLGEVYGSGLGPGGTARAVQDS